ncbi:MAG: hypothetical protein LBD02_09805 [Christensenellaceae bacterium]|jgi:hypothetical protein|nr:hypothetical protein [Christensenellaceae bacterium]
MPKRRNDGKNRDRHNRAGEDLMPPFAVGSHFPTETGYGIPVVRAFRESADGDVLGSYTGVANKGERPEQDADDS